VLIFRSQKGKERFKNRRERACLSLQKEKSALVSCALEKRRERILSLDLKKEERNCFCFFKKKESARSQKKKTVLVSRF
jgi:hypothetical protein